MNNLSNITYVSNAGILLNINNKKILVDGLCVSRISIYKSTPTEICNKIIEGFPPFDNIDNMLITHKHSDHFNANLTCRFLENNINTVVISSREVISNIKSCNPNLPFINLIELNPLAHNIERINIDGVDIIAMSMIHDGKEYMDVTNLTFLIDYGIKILHLGDAAPIKENFEYMDINKYKVDVLLANFPYVSIPRARKIIKSYINPKRILVIHLPYKDLDRFNWISVAKKSYQRNKDNFVHTTFIENIGSSINV